MAIKKTNIMWNGLVLTEEINTETGVMQIKDAEGKLGVLAQGTGSNWNLVNPSTFKNLYTNATGKNLNSDQFETQFYKQTSVFNDHRAESLTTTANNANDGGKLATQYFESGIPGMKNPVTGQYVNQDGSITSSNPFSNDPSTVVDSNNPNTGGANDSINSETGADVNGSGDSSAPGGADALGNQNIKTFTAGGSQDILRYPLEMPNGFEYDYISIQAAEYKPSGLEAQAGDLSQANVGGKRFETVILPMQPNLSESHSVNYDDSSANFMQLAGGQLAEGAIKGLGSGDFAKIGEAGKQALANAQSIAGDNATKSYLAAYFVGQAVGTNLVGRATGMVVNPNMTVLFSGPTLRSFQFSFPMTPRSADEAIVIRKIVRAFKRNSLPQRSGSTAFLMTPRVFLLKYIFKSNSTTQATHPFLNKFKPCMLASFNVSYTPDNSYMTLKDGSMTRYTIDLTFKEVVPNYADEYNQIDEPNMGF